MNLQFNADIVIEPRDGDFAIWQDGTIIAAVTSEGRTLIVAGASARKLSVYDVAAEQYLTGTIDQLFRLYDQPAENVG